MEVGQVGFHNQKLVKKIVVHKSNEIVNRLNKTKKEEENPSLAEDRAVRATCPFFFPSSNRVGAGWTQTCCGRWPRPSAATAAHLAPYLPSMPPPRSNTTRS